MRLGRARRHVISVRPQAAGGRLTVRLNERFASAPQEVLEAVGAWIRAGKRARAACRTLDDWIAATFEAPERIPRGGEALRPRGATHDLTALAAELRAGELAADFAAPGSFPAITWGRRARSRSRHSLRLGSYDHQLHLVRVHAVLDQPAVPAWFVRSVLFHELLHAALGVRREGGRNVYHGPEFRAREERHPDHARALAWQEAHLPALIRSARSGRPLVARVARPARPARRAGWMQRLLFD